MVFFHVMIASFKSKQWSKHLSGIKHKNILPSKLTVKCYLETHFIFNRVTIADVITGNGRFLGIVVVNTVCYSVWYLKIEYVYVTVYGIYKKDMCMLQCMQSINRIY